MIAHVAHEPSSVWLKAFQYIGVARGGQEALTPSFSNISCRTVLREAMSQTKYCCSLNFEIFWFPKILGWLHFCFETILRDTKSFVDKKDAYQHYLSQSKIEKMFLIIGGSSVILVFVHKTSHS